MGSTEDLAELGIDAESYRVLRLLPLVYVAWADGKVQSAERAIIESVARERGWLQGNGAAVLAGWLDSPPRSREVTAGLRLLRDLAAEKRGEDRESITVESLESLILFCRDVAAAAGGRFGLSDPVTEDEEVALTRMCEALGIDGGKHWEDLVAELEKASG